MIKILGYLISIIGLVIILFSKQVTNVPQLSSLSALYILISGFVIVLIGAFLVIKKSPGKQAGEVPIFEGKGKKRKVVGYQREN